MKPKLFIVTILALSVIVFAGGWVLLHALQASKRSAAKLEDYGTVPNIALTERSGARMELASLKGKVWVADFIFTHCGGTCQSMTSKMSEMQGRLTKIGNVRLVSISVDPKRDSTERLQTFATTYKADQNKWLFLTGDEAEIQNLAKNTFHLATEGATATDPIIHSTRFMLIDANEHIRGYYDGLDSNATKKLEGDLRTLVADGE